MDHTPDIDFLPDICEPYSPYKIFVSRTHGQYGPYVTFCGEHGPKVSTFKWLMKIKNTSNGHIYKFHASTNTSNNIMKNTNVIKSAGGSNTAM